MTGDYVALWGLTIFNTLAILLLVRQLATLPQFAGRKSGPKIGSPMAAFALETPSGVQRRSSDLASAYTLLFVSSTCEPCNRLFEDLRGVGRPKSAVYIVAGGADAAAAAKATGEDGPLYDEFFLGGRGELFQQLQIPGTPYAVAVREGRVVAAGPTATADQLKLVADASGDPVAPPTPA